MFNHNSFLYNTPSLLICSVLLVAIIAFYLIGIKLADITIMNLDRPRRGIIRMENANQKMVELSEMFD